jgi:hypothetical protein
MVPPASHRLSGGSPTRGVLLSPVHLLLNRQAGHTQACGSGASIHDDRPIPSKRIPRLTCRHILGSVPAEHPAGWVLPFARQYQLVLRTGLARLGQVAPSDLTRSGEFDVLRHPTSLLRRRSLRGLPACLVATLNASEWFHQPRTAPHCLTRRRSSTPGSMRHPDRSPSTGYRYPRTRRTASVAPRSVKYSTQPANLRTRFKTK